MKAQKKYPLYAQLEALPGHLNGEILNGQLHTQPRPSGRHAQASSVLGMDIGGAYHRQRGGPGGWWIIDEPEIHFVLDTEVTVPDIAGWRKERMPKIPQGHKFNVTPDWICEVLSPSNKSTDREIKKPLYAHYGVQFLWLVDPIAKTLEAYQLDGTEWRTQGMYSADDTVCIEPFDAISIHLPDLWG